MIPIPGRLLHRVIPRWPAAVSGEQFLFEVDDLSGFLLRGTGRFVTRRPLLHPFAKLLKGALVFSDPERADLSLMVGPIQRAQKGWFVMTPAE